MANRKKPLVLDASSDLKAARKVFKDGGVIAYPTETFYGLGVDPFNPDAIKRLFELKGRSYSSPVSVILNDTRMLGRVAQEVPERAQALIKKFWPGPLTIIFNARREVPPMLISGTASIGVRIPGSAEARRLAALLDSPVTATSANPSGKKPPVTAAEVLEYFDGAIDILIDGGRLPGKKGSTIVDVTGPRIRLIRQGEIPFEEIEGE